MDNWCCPVCAVVVRALDMLADKASPDTLLCSFRDAPTLPWQHVWGKDMVRAIEDRVVATGLQRRGYQLDKVRSHSLRSGGATALFINRHDILTIQRAGCWTGSTFMEYIHGQLDITTRGLAQSMSQQTPYMNMAH